VAVGIKQAGGLEERCTVFEIAAQSIFELALEIVKSALLGELAVGEGSVVCGGAAPGASGLLTGGSRFGMTKVILGERNVVAGWCSDG
jgi:hypothetical protein